MRVWSFIAIILWLICVGPYAHAQSTVIYTDDFEGAVTGWSNNNTDFDADVTRFLGRFDNSPKSTSRTFTVPPSTDSVVIAFDFYRFDSWDSSSTYGFDRFEVDIDGVEIFSLPFTTIPQAARSGSSGTVTWSHTPLTGKVELAFGTGFYWFDQLHRFEIIVNDPGTTLDLTLRADINQGGNDESAGYDNITISALPVLPNMTAVKTVEVVSTEYALPGSLVDYTIAVQNTGGTLDSGTLALVDKLPDSVVLFTGDLDGNGNPVTLTDSSTPASGITCCAAANVEYSDSASDPPVFGYVPMSDYDPNITYVRITPTGAIRDAQFDPVDLDFTFRTRIK